MGRRWRTAAVVSTLAALALYALVPVAPAACEQTARHWPQLNAWSSDSILRPFALLLKAC